MGRLPIDEPDDPVSEMIHALHRAGWSIGDVGAVQPDGYRSWTVHGTNG